MASLSCLACYTTATTTYLHNHKLTSFKSKYPTATLVTHKSLSPTPTITPLLPKQNQFGQNILRENQFVDHYRLGLIVDDAIYRQIYVIRSNEVGLNKTARFKSIPTLLQETSLNQMEMTGLYGDGFGVTPEMVKNDLIWVVTRMQVEVDHYPIWGELIDIDTWLGESKRNGIRRDWVVRSHTTGMVFARATSNWVMMNQNTRRLARIPETVRTELSPWYVEKPNIKQMNEKIEKLDIAEAKYVISNMKPKRSDLDLNNHVNNAKYVNWMLETIPDQFLETHQISSMILEYRKECGRSDLVQSLCKKHEEDGIFEDEFDMEPLIRYTHLLHIKGEANSGEIVTGRTTWKKEISLPPILHLEH